MKIYSKKLEFVLLLSITVLVFVFWFLLTLALRNQRIFEKIADRSKTFQKSMTESIEEYSVNCTTSCEGNLLDQQYYHYSKETGGSYDISRMISKWGSCQLLHYTFDQTVGCFDALYERHNSLRNSSSILNPINRLDKRLHFAFIGDSRIRQQFLNFLKLIPDYDRKSQPNPFPISYHGNMEVTSDILRLRLSFQWRPILNDTIIDTIRHWATDSHSDQPNLIVISIVVWHMLQSEGADFKLYQKKLKELAPFLGQLANTSKVIWLNQFPTIEFYGETGAHNTNIFSEKIYHYNQAVRRILGKHNSVRIWDSSNRLAEEYVRGCALSQRVQLGTYIFVDPADLYVNCKDYTHAGYSALSQATQLLFNKICNTYKTYL